MTAQSVIDLTAAKLTSSWEPVKKNFDTWAEKNIHLLEHGLAPSPTIKVLIFLALLETGKTCSYDEIKQIFREKNVIKGSVPDNTLRTSVLNLGKTLEKFNHPFALKSFRGRFQLIKRTAKLVSSQNEKARTELLEGNSIKK